MIRVHGNGIAALACVRAMMDRGLPVTYCDEPRESPLVLLLNRDTLDLITDLFDIPRPDDLGHAVERRIVCRKGEKPATMTAQAIAIRVDDLVTELKASITCNAPRAFEGSDPCFEVDATGRKAEPALRWGAKDSLTFGQRMVVAAEIGGSLVDAVMEMTDRHWLFAFPIAADKVMLQIMLTRPPAEAEAIVSEALDATKTLKRQLDGIEIIRLATFEAAPRILPTIATQRWLAVGQAAFSMDPICGDGTGSAIRSAILAAATLSAFKGEHDHGAIAHYKKRHERSFAMHLRHVAEYYRPFTRYPDWALEMRSTHRFLAGEMPKRILNDATMRYMLKDGELVAAE